MSSLKTLFFVIALVLLVQQGSSNWLGLGDDPQFLEGQKHSGELSIYPGYLKGGLVSATPRTALSDLGEAESSVFWDILSIPWTIISFPFRVLKFIFDIITLPLKIIWGIIKILLFPVMLILNPVGTISRMFGLY